MSKKLLSLGVFAALAATAFTATDAAAVPKTYYVDQAAGSDTAAGTSQSAPWKSLAKVAATTLAPGDTVLLSRGRTWSGGLAVRGSGSATAPVTIGAYGTGARPIVQGNEEACVDLPGNYITVQDLQVGVAADAGRCSWAGVEVGGDHDKVLSNYITGAGAGVYIAPSADGTEVTQNDLVDNNHMTVVTPGGSDDSGAFAILVQGNGSDIGWNRISGSIAVSDDFGGLDGAAIEIFYGSGNVIHHNISEDNESFTELGTDAGDPDGVSRDNVYEYNAVFGAKTRGGIVTRGGEDQNGPVTGTVFRNNSVRLSNAESEGFVCYGGCTNQTLKLTQNVVQAAMKVGYADIGWTATDHNVFYGGQRQFTPGATDKVADPKFTSATNLIPQSTSPAIGLGTTKYADVDVDGNAIGTRIDAGAYQFTP
ncbi:right-handed parallel beta-helix repeat-containing protein [Amycolatopsis lexingtonensis]|uniref:right-handed parallel beta-helix repeat-containing protein n=1 Tax=Amycolatopsis lexingtonensis TaxID=218822 RepID=UPI003F71B30E